MTFVAWFYCLWMFCLLYLFVRVCLRGVVGFGMSFACCFLVWFGVCDLSLAVFFSVVDLCVAVVILFKLLLVIVLLGCDVFIVAL